MRIFIDIAIPEKIKVKLRKLQEDFDENTGKINWVEDQHLTLKFLGEVSEREVERIKERLREVKFNSFKIKLRNFGVFPSEKRINVIWIGIEENKELKELQDDIEEKLGYERERRGFKPHLTIGRVKFIKDREKLLDNLKLRFSEDFKVKSFKLIKSILTSKGAEYEVLEEYEM